MNWVYPSDLIIAPGMPVRSVDGMALRDNYQAMGEGAIGAPRIVTAALKQPVAGLGYIICQLVGGFAFDLWPDGMDNPQVPTTQEASYLHPGYYRQSPDWNRHIAVMALVPGDVTVLFQHRSEGSGSYVRVLKNQTQIGESYYRYSGYDAWYSIDVSGLSTGDVIVIQQRAENAATTSQMFNVFIMSGNPDMAVI